MSDPHTGFTEMNAGNYTGLAAPEGLNDRGEAPDAGTQAAYVPDGQAQAAHVPEAQAVCTLDGQTPPADAPGEPAPELAEIAPLPPFDVQPLPLPGSIPGRVVRGGAILPKTMDARRAAPRGEGGRFNNIRGASIVMAVFSLFGALLVPALALCVNLYYMLGRSLGFIFFGMNEAAMYDMMRTAYYGGLGVVFLGLVYTVAAMVFYHGAALNLEYFGAERRSFPPFSASLLSMLPAVNFFTLYAIQRELLFSRDQDGNPSKRAALNLGWFFTWAFLPVLGLSAYSVYRDAVTVAGNIVKFLPNFTPGTVFLVILAVVFGLAAFVFQIILPLTIASRHHKAYRRAAE